MKAVILCGGLGTRLAEETNNIPKPMVKIGDKPIIFNGGLRGEEDFVWAQKQDIDCAGSAYFFLEPQFNSVLISYGVNT